MTPRVRWVAGASGRTDVVERALRGEGDVQVLHDNPRRRLVLVGAVGDALVVKQFRTGSKRHRRRERWKARLGRAPARREWRALRRLHAAGLAVPEPVALGTLPDGDALLVLRAVPGAPFAERLAAAHGGERRALLEGLGTLIARVHAAGFVHGDLHSGNVLVGKDDAPVLLDWQHARRSRAARAQRRDLGQLDYALWGLASASDRLRVRRAALGERSSRAALRAVGRAAVRRAARHAAGRTRRTLRPGRLAAPFADNGARGLRLRAHAPETLAAALAAHREALAGGDSRVLADGPRARITSVALAAGQRAVVKETPWRGPARALADLVRGTAGRRAWRAGHGLDARRIGAARPLAYLVQRRLGLPARSWVVLEDLRPAIEAAFALEAGFADADEVLEALVRLALALHRRGVDHGDLKGTHVLLRRGTQRRLEARLIDLEGVRFRRRLRERRRRRSLVELNASLPDAFPASARRAAFERYARALPFRDGRDATLARVVAESLARRHRWSGAGCRLARRGPLGAP